MQEKICFILYKPAVPGNIGAAARAIKTMGFKDFRLVNPADHLADEAKMMAHGSHDILENCKIFGSYQEAIEDVDFIICTTAKLKSAKVDYIQAADLAKFVEEKQSVCNKIAIVFGTEESGLPKSILLHGNVGLTIPMKTEHPSLNLSQAVMVVAWELSRISHIKSREISEQQQMSTWKQLQERSESILEELDIQKDTPLYHRIIERLSFMKASDARLAHSVSSKLIDLLERRKKAPDKK